MIHFNQLMDDMSLEASRMISQPGSYYKMTTEVVKIIGVKLFLEYVAKYSLEDFSEDPLEQIHFLAIATPIFEEIVFRGFIQQIVARAVNRTFLIPKQKSEEEKMRVRISAVSFASIHFLNCLYLPPAEVLKQFMWSSLVGWNYGYLMEKRHTLSLSILSHGLNNITAIYGTKPERALMTSSLLALNQLGAYTLHRTNISETLTSKFRKIICFKS